jgi:hypothetical protein
MPIRKLFSGGRLRFAAMHADADNRPEVRAKLWLPRYFLDDERFAGAMT